MNRIVRNLPNCVTMLNLVGGMMAIICAFKGEQPWWGLTGWQWGAFFIGVSAIADFLDGYLARILKAYSAMGKELDSLCDLVSFGVAPSLLVFNVMDMTPDIDPWLKWIVLLVPLVAAVRLARFNIDTRQASFFIGMPVPANAIFWIGFCALVAKNTAFLTYPTIFIPLVLVETWFMLSPFKLLSLKFHDYAFHGNNIWRYLLVAAAIALVFCMGVAGLIWLVVFYIVLSLCIKV